MMACPRCDGDVVPAFELPNGDVAHADDVPGDEAPKGASRIDVCRSCGHRVTS